MSEDRLPREETPIPAVLLPPKDGSRVVRERVKNTNWKGVLGIVIAFVIPPNLVALASSALGGAQFVAALVAALITPLVAVLAGILMAFDIRRGAESSSRLAVAAIAVGMGMSALMLIALAFLSASAR